MVCEVLTPKSMSSEPTMELTSHIATAEASCPPPPRDLSQLGIPSSMAMDLVLRFLREHGTGSLTSLQRSLKLSFPVVETLFQQLRQQMLIEIKGTAGGDYLFTLTGAARDLAAERSEMCRYA